MTRTRLSALPLEARDTPALIAGSQLIAGSLAATPAFDAAGPLGGVVSVTVAQQGTHVTESLVWVGPSGRTLLTETATLSVNPRTGAVSGTLTATGANGRTVTGSLTGQLTATDPANPAALDRFEETTTLVGPNGRTVTQHGVYVGGQDGVTSTAVWAGPDGQSATRTGTASVDPATGAVTLTGSLTGPNGRSVDWDRTFGG